MTEERFIQLYDELAEDLFGYCYLRVPDREKAKELVEETFKRAWQDISEHKGHLHLFVYKTTNGLLGELRREMSIPLTAYSHAGLIIL